MTCFDNRKSKKMKIRTDFVSNSSSSSFIIGESEIFQNFAITKQDILDALIDAYNAEAYEKDVERCRKSCEKYPEYYAKNIKYNDYGPIYVYDLSDENDRNKAIDMWGELLSDWTSTNTHFGDDGKVYIGADNVRRFENIVDNIAKIHGAYEWSIMSYILGETTEVPKKFIRSNEKDPETGNYGHYEPLDQNVIETIKELKEKVGYMTNLDVLKCDLARFFIHADDNGLPCCGHKDENYDSEEGTYDRVCEIIYNYLVKKGKIKPDDQAFMEEMRIDDKYLSALDKENGNLWDFVNGKNLTYKDLRYSTLTQCMHEG